jgi:hypothetical protein
MEAGQHQASRCSSLNWSALVLRITFPLDSWKMKGVNCRCRRIVVVQDIFAANDNTYRTLAKGAASRGIVVNAEKDDQSGFVVNRLSRSASLRQCDP